MVGNCAALHGGKPRTWYTCFDLFSPNNPVAGGGAVDPFSGGGFYIDDGSGDLNEFLFSNSSVGMFRSAIPRRRLATPPKSDG